LMNMVGILAWTATSATIVVSVGKACSKMNTYAVETDAGIRTWCADDEAQAIEQHKDDFGDDETIIRVWEITNESLGLESKHG